MKKIRFLILLLIVSLFFNLNVLAIEENEDITNTNNETSEVVTTDGEVSEDTSVDEEDEVEETVTTENSSYVDTDDKVYDFANLFSDSEEKKLYNDIYKYTNKTSYEAVIVTTYDNNGKHVEDYAMDFYEDNNFREDGIIFVIDMLDRGYTMMVHGAAIDTYTDSDIDYILDELYYDMRDGDYYGAASNFLSLSTKYYSNDSSYSYGGTVSTEDMTIWLKLLGYPLIVTVIVILIMAFQNRMVKKANSSKSFLNNETKVITTISDIFLGSTTTKVRIETSSSSGSGGMRGGSGGRSSGMRSSSSGGSFRGGSRRF